jgi:hypothetical protein
MMKKDELLSNTYPCFREMCKFMKKDLDLSCEEMLEGCKEENHCK